MNKLLCAVLVAGLGMAGSAWAEDGAELTKKSGCLSCHSVDKKVLGPSFKDIAAKYKGDKGAEAALSDKIRKGGGGAWGTMPMPAQAKPADAGDLKVVVQWILAQK